MDLTSFVQYSVIAGAATTAATQALKAKWIPVPAQKYPRLTAAAVALIVSAIATYQYKAANGFVSTNWHDWLILAVPTLIISALTYNNLLKGAQK